MFLFLPPLPPVNALPQDLCRETECLSHTTHVARSNHIKNRFNNIFTCKGVFGASEWVAVRYHWEGSKERPRVGLTTRVYLCILHANTLPYAQYINLYIHTYNVTLCISVWSLAHTYILCMPILYYSPSVQCILIVPYYRWSCQSGPGYSWQRRQRLHQCIIYWCKCIMVFIKWLPF